MGGHAAAIRQQIEAKLADRIPAALSPLAQQAPRLQPTGNTPLDTLLGGGLPLGSICEATGPDGSGRSSIALSLVARASREGACAYIDANDTLSPHSAAAAGVPLGNLLWVRFASSAQRVMPASTSHSVQRAVEAQPRQRESVPQQNCGGPHPRGETKDLAPALEQMLFYKEERRRRKMEGTPGYPNQPLGLAASQDQVEWERFNARKADDGDPLRQLDKAAAEQARQRATTQVSAPRLLKQEQKPWSRLDRVLRATDQVLQFGGFRVVVLDLASIAPEQALRIPAATWWRFRKAVQQNDALLLLLTKEPCARSSAACVLECSVAGPPGVAGTLTWMAFGAEVARQRTSPALGRKTPGRVTQWDATPAWMQAVGR